MLGKGLEMSYLALVLILLTFLVISFAYFQKLFSKTNVPEYNVKADVRYTCVNSDGKVVDKETLATLLYGIASGQCKHLEVTVSTPLSFEELSSMAGKNAVKLNECKLPSVNTGSLYVFCRERIEGKLTLEGRGFEGSDVLVCCV